MMAREGGSGGGVGEGKMGERRRENWKEKERRGERRQENREEKESRGERRKNLGRVTVKV